jgi:hypothetical protein
VPNKDVYSIRDVVETSGDYPHSASNKKFIEKQYADVLFEKS